MADIQITAEFDDIKRLDAEIKRVTASSKILQTQAQKTGASVDALANAEAIRGVNQFGNVVQAAGKNTNRMGMQLQQVGYQVGDFAVQVQGGTNVAVAFGQQMSQLLGIFGAGGALAGAGVAIISAFVAPMLQMKKEASDVQKQFEELTKTIDGYNDAIENATRSSADMKDEFGKFSDQVRKVFESLREIEKLKFDEKINAIANSIEGIDVSRINGPLSYLQANMFRDFLNLSGTVRQTSEEVVTFVRALQSLQNAEGVESQILAAEQLLSVLEEVSGPYKSMTAEQKLFFEGIQRLIPELAKLGEAQRQSAAEEKARADAQERTLAAAQALLDEVEAAVSAVDDVKDRVAALEKEYGKTVVQAALLAGLDIESGINLAAIAASNLSSEMKAALASALGLVNLSTKYSMMEGSAGAKRMRQYAGRGTVSDQDPIVGETGESIYKEPPKVRGSRGGGGGGKSEAEQMAERIANFEKQLQLEEELIGKTETRKRIIQALGVEFVNQNAVAVAKYEADIARITELNRLEEQRNQIMQTVESSLVSGSMAIIDGTKSVKDAFKDMARQIIAELYRVLVVQRMVGAISGAIGGIGGGSSLAPTTSLRPPVRPFANGGVIGSPTMFPMSGGQTGLMGEAGPEAIMPLKRDKNGRLGVSVDGGSGAVNVVNNINVTGGTDPAAIRMEVAKLMPQITNATKTAVIDARRRGGQMRAAFS